VDVDSSTSQAEVYVKGYRWGPQKMKDNRRGPSMVKGPSTPGSGQCAHCVMLISMHSRNVTSKVLPINLLPEIGYLLYSTLTPRATFVSCWRQ
jgi:hypothetical protein